MRHDFLNELPDDGTEHLWHGYPDECFAFTSFTDSLVAQVLYGGWAIQPPITVVQMALVVDFVSEREAEAEASLAHGWNGTWEYPTGVANTVHSRVEINEQNARIGRHFSLIASAITQEQFHHAVGEKLLDVHTCPDKERCDVCRGRIPRGLGDALQILATGTRQEKVHLFARWSPSEELAKLLEADGIKLVPHRLGNP